MSLEVVFGDGQHWVAAGEVAVERAERAGEERRAHRECVEGQALLVQVTAVQPPVVLAEAES